MKQFLFIIISIVLFSSCEKNISIDLPAGDPKLVVEGYVETGLPPYILLSQSTGYFDPIDPSALVNAPVQNAEVFLSDGTATVRLSELTFNGTKVNGVYVALDSATLTPLMTGTEGRTYTLTVTARGSTVHAVTKLNAAVPLDSVWYKNQENSDTLGLVWAKMTDPDTLENCYRWFAKRIGKDQSFLAPIGSTFEDKFINGKQFDFAYNRGSVSNSSATDDNNDEAGYFKVGDTIIVKFCSVDRSTYEFWRDAESQISNNGSPFAVPSNVKSNIVGGLGLFASYSASFDTIVAH